MYDRWRPEDDFHYRDAENIAKRPRGCGHCPLLAECRREGACRKHVEATEDAER